MLCDIILVMNFGIIFGVMVVVVLVGKYVLIWKLICCDLLIVIVGGLLMGYGVWLVYGCNIGVYFGGFVFGLMYGWFWLLFGFFGLILGMCLWLCFDMD